MKARSFANLALGCAVSAAVLYVLWVAFGAAGLALGTAATVICVMPLLDILGDVPRFLGGLALRRYAGRHYSFRGRQVDVDIDARATCWVSTADIRKILPSLPADAVLQRLQPAQVRECGEPRVWRITPDALAAVLERSADVDAAKFRQWLASQVQSPARRRLERGMQIR